MKTVAAILVKQGEPIVVDEVEIRKPLSSGQVLVEVIETGFCSTQLREIWGQNGPDKYLPHLFGHEAIGVVREVSDAGSHLNAGDSVLMHWRPGMGRAAQGYSYKWGTGEVNSGPIATFSQYAVVSENRVTRSFDIPNIPARSTIGCSISTGWGIANLELNLSDDQKILILGLGPTGLAVFLGIDPSLKIHKTVVDPSPTKRALLRGTDASVFASAVDLPSDASFDAIIDCSGKYDDWSGGMGLLRDGGTFIKSGMSSHDNEFSIRSNDLLRGLSIKGTNGGGFNPNRDLTPLLSHLNMRKDDYMTFPIEPFGLSQINSAVDFLRQERAFKVMLDPWQ